MENNEPKKSTQPKKVQLKVQPSTTTASDSDHSLENVSLKSLESLAENRASLNEKKPKKSPRRASEWEIMEGLKEGQRFDQKPSTFSGYLHKKRKWPLKGWHKRYFMLDKGIMVYGKGATDVNKGKVHGTIDIGLSVISYKDERRRIDIDAEEYIYHLKAKTDEEFDNWVEQLTAHRLYRQHIMTYGTNVGALFRTSDGRRSIIAHPPEIVIPHEPSSMRFSVKPRDPSTMRFSIRDPSTTRFSIRDPSTTRFSIRDPTTTRASVKPPITGPSRLDIWIDESIEALEKFQFDANVVEENITKLAKLLQQIESSTVNTTTIAIAESSGCEALCSPKDAKKDRRKFGLKKKKSTKGGSVDLSIQFNNKCTTGNDTDNASPISAHSFSGLTYTTPINHTLSSSTLPVPANAVSNVPTPDSLSNADVISLSAENQMRDDFLALAKAVFSTLRSLTSGLTTEREKLKTALEKDKIESEVEAPVNVSNQNVVNLKNNLNQVLQQNADLKKRLVRIHETADITDMSTIALESWSENQRLQKSSLSSSCVSATEYFDAEDLSTEEPWTSDVDLEDEDKDEESEVPDATRSESSSESLSSGDGSSSDSDMGVEVSPVCSLIGASRSLMGRRSTLPCPRPPCEGLSLWNLLSRNIGKDLSQISMPVALNEPLNVLQRLCEELEYSELLDTAASMEDPYDRMAHIAAFAVSSYASTFSRAGSKPFNPLLGETYECVRGDKGFKFIAEQVSHHPPIGACYAESDHFTFWQDARVKTKFWGKSMEFQPLGFVQVLLPRTGDLYRWNKVTTCVHNLFSGQRWVDQYGELTITNGTISCVLTFSKASYWSGKRHEVFGSVLDASGTVVRKLFGTWSEAMYCGEKPSAQCIWRAHNLPANHERYYGFTRFAIQLNELGADSNLLPPTDTRFRPDQRALEDGDLDTAEAVKMELEMAQRERRKQREEEGIEYVPKWFSNPEEDTWEYNGKYFEAKIDPGFENMEFEPLW